MDTIKILQNMITKLEDSKIINRDQYLIGYNYGIEQAITLLETKIKEIENINN